MNDIHVEIASPDDFEAMMIFLREMHQENGVASMADDKVSQALMRGLHQDRALVGVIRSEGAIAASVGLFVGQWWYSYENHLEDLWLFVGASYRRRPMARPLIEFAKTAAVQLQMPLLMGVLSNERTLPKLKLYERQLPHAGGLFLFNSGVTPHV